MPGHLIHCGLSSTFGVCLDVTESLSKMIVVRRNAALLSSRSTYLQGVIGTQLFGVENDGGVNFENFRNG